MSDKQKDTKPEKGNDQPSDAAALRMAEQMKRDEEKRAAKGGQKDLR